MMGDCALSILADVVKLYGTNVSVSRDVFIRSVTGLCDVILYRWLQAATVLGSDDELLQKLRTLLFASYEDDAVKMQILKLLTLLVV
jgi:hypothetical protein